MADKKISALTGATTPLAGTEVLPIVQSGSTVKVAVSDLTAGRSVSAASLALTTTPLPVSSGGTGLTAVTTGYIPFGDSATALNIDAVLFWDNTNKRLGVGNSSPSQKIQIGNNPGNNGASNYILIAGSGGVGSISSGVKLINYWNGIPYETGIYASQTDNASAELALKVGYYDGAGASQRTGLFINQDANVSLPLGNLAFGTSGKGIDFSATPGTGTSELLADYEEGTFTPSYTGSTTNPTVAYSTQEGIYTKVGRLVTFKIVLTTSSSSGGSGTLGVTGLPFTVSSGAGGSMQFSFAFSTPVLQAIPSGTSISLYDAYAGTTNSQPTVLALTAAGGSTFLQFVGQYFV